MKAFFALATIALSKASRTSEVQGRFLQSEGTEVTVQFNGAPITAFDINGDCFFGDILLGKTQEIVANGVQLVNPEVPQTEALATQAGRYWPNGQVPYTFAPGLPSNIQNDFEYGVRAWNTQTGVKLFKRTTESAYIYVTTGQGCFSALGRTGSRQTLNLQRECGGPTAIHEIGHAVGLYHEQSRPDRDQYIRINYENIQDNRRSQYDIARGARQIGEYDYYSIMHYFDTGFSKNGRKTFVPIQPGVDASRIGRGSNLSAKDLAAARVMYPGGGGGGGDRCDVANCRQCSRNNFCSQCNSGYRLVNGRCQKIDDPTPCNVANCVTCSRSNFCSRCQSGYTVVNGRCQKDTTTPPGDGCNASCFKGCKSCASPAYYHCLSCCPGFQQQGSTCRG